MSHGLGRRVPPNFEHVTRYPYAAVAPRAVTTVERITQLPYWHWSHDQGSQGACVGFGSSMAMAIINLIQRRDAVPQMKPNTVRYDPWWLWDRAKEIDAWSDTNPGDSNGTSVSAAMDILRTQGHVQIPNTSNARAVNPSPLAANGIQVNRWASSVDELRTSIASGVPISIGVNWYTNFDKPIAKTSNNHWIGEGDLGSVRGGHCVCVYGASDQRQAFRIKNSWGKSYPLVWMPYVTMQRLIDESGEATIITDL